MVQQKPNTLAFFVYRKQETGNRKHVNNTTGSVTELLSVDTNSNSLLTTSSHVKAKRGTYLTFLGELCVRIVGYEVDEILQTKSKVKQLCSGGKIHN